MTKQGIYNYLRKAGCTHAGAAALMANIQAESAFRANNLQDSYNSSMGVSDEAYVAEVDSGRRTFEDSAGFGYCQWTYYARKRKLLASAEREAPV